MTKEEFLEELATTLNEETENVKPETQVDSLEGWDSTGLLSVIAMFDGELGIQVDVERLRSCNSVQGLMDLAGGKIE